MPSFNVNDAGTWRSLQSLNVNDAGTWRPLAIWVNDSGTWRQILATVVVELGSNKALVDIGNNDAVTVSLNSSGAWTGTADSGAFTSTWVTPGGAAAGYDVKATVLSGTITSGTTGSFLNLGTTRTWTNILGTVGVMRLDIFTTADHVTVVDTCTVNFN